MKLAIRLLTLAMLALTLAAAPVVTTVYAAPDNDPPPPPQKKKKSSEARPGTEQTGIEQTAFADGYRAAVTMMIAGREAVAKASAVGKAILARSSRLMREAGFDDFTESSVEVLGSEASYGKHSRAGGSREVVLKPSST